MGVCYCCLRAHFGRVPDIELVEKPLHGSLLLLRTAEARREAVDHFAILFLQPIQTSTSPPASLCLILIQLHLSGDVVDKDVQQRAESLGAAWTQILNCEKREDKDTGAEL